MPILGHSAARSGSGARPTTYSAREGGLPQSDHHACCCRRGAEREVALLAGGRRISPRIGSSYGSARASPISGRTSASATPRYRVFLGTTRAEGAVHIGLGETIRKNRWGRDRKYVVAFLSSGSPQQPLAEFVAADDYEETRELVAVIREATEGGACTAPATRFPRVYTEQFRTQLYSERVVYPGVWNKVVVVAREDDDETMLNHALIQGRRRRPT